MWDAFEYHPPPPPPKKRATRFRSRSQSRHDDDDSLEQEPAVMTPRTQRRRRHQRKRHAADKYRATPVERSYNIQAFDFDGAEVFSLSPVELLSRRMGPAQGGYHTDSNDADDSSGTSDHHQNIQAVGKQQFPISLDGCALHAGGIILDSVEHWTGGRQETNRSPDKSKEADKRKAHVEKIIPPQAVERAEEKLFVETMLEEDLELATADSPIKATKPDFRRVLSLDLLEEEDNRDNFLRERIAPDWESRTLSPPMPESMRSDVVASVPRRPMTPTKLRTPNQSLDGSQHSHDKRPLTPTAMRSPANSVKDELENDGPPLDARRAHGALHIITRHTPVDAPERTPSCDNDHPQARLPDAPPRLSIRIPHDDESFSTSSGLGEDVDQDGSDQDDWDNEESISSSAHECHRNASSAEMSSRNGGDEAVERLPTKPCSAPQACQQQNGSHPSVKELEETAAFLEKLAAAPSPKELHDARLYLSRLTRTPSPKELHNARSFFEQILDHDTKHNSRNDNASSSSARSYKSQVAPRPESPTNMDSRHHSSCASRQQRRGDGGSHRHIKRDFSQSADQRITEHDGEASFRLSQRRISPSRRNATRVQRELRASECLVCSPPKNGFPLLRSEPPLDAYARPRAENKVYRHSDTSDSRGRSPKSHSAITITHDTSRRSSFSNTFSSVPQQPPQKLKPRWGAEDPFRANSVSRGFLYDLEERQLLGGSSSDGLVEIISYSTMDHAELSQLKHIQQLSSHVRGRGSRQISIRSPQLNNGPQITCEAQIPPRNRKPQLLRDYSFPESEAFAGLSTPAGDEVRDDLIEIISIADSSMGDQRQSDPQSGTATNARRSRGTKFPPFSMLPDIPETPSDDDEPGLDAELLRRKRDTGLITVPSSSSPDQALSVRQHARVYSMCRTGGPEVVFRKENQRCDDSDTSWLDLEILNDVDSKEGHLRMGGPESISSRRETTMSCSDMSSHVLMRKQFSGDNPRARASDDDTIDEGNAVMLPSSFIPRLHSSPPRPDRKKRQSKDCPPSYIRPAAKSDKEDAPGVVMLGVVPVGNVDADAPVQLTPPNEREMLFAIPVGEDEESQSAASALKMSEATEDCSFLEQKLVARLKDENANEDLGIEVPNESRVFPEQELRPEGSNAQAQADSAITLPKGASANGNYVGAVQAHSIEVATTRDNTPSSLNVDISCNPVGAAITETSSEGMRQSSISSIFRGLEKMLPAATTHERRTPFLQAADEGTFENPLSIWSEDAANTKTEERRIDVSRETIVTKDECGAFILSGQILDQARSAGIVLLQPSINIYTGQMPADPSIQDTQRHAGQLSEPDLHAKEERTPSHEKERTPAIAAGTSEQSSTDEHTIIFIEDLSSYCSPKNKQLRPLHPVTSVAYNAGVACDVNAQGDFSSPLAGTETTRMSDPVSGISPPAVFNTRSPSIIRLDRDVSKVDAILARAVEAVTQPHQCGDAAAKAFTKVEDDDDNDGLEDELGHLAESEQLLRRELAHVHCSFQNDYDPVQVIPSIDGGRVGSDESERSTLQTSFTSSGVLESSETSSSREEYDRIGEDSRMDRVVAFDDDKHKQSPIYVHCKLPCNAPKSNIPLTNTSSVHQTPAGAPADTERLGATTDFAVLHSRLQEDVEILHLEDASPQADDVEAEEIEVVFVEKAFMADEFFRYGESKGMVFDWIRKPSDEAASSSSCSPPFKVEEYAIGNCTELEEHEISFLRTVKRPRSEKAKHQTAESADVRQHQVKIQQAPSDRHPQPNVEREIISLLHFDDAADLSVFRPRIVGTLKVAPHYSRPDNHSRTGADPEDCLPHRPGRTGSDPPGASTNPYVLRTNATSDGDTDAVSASLTSESHDSTIHSSRFSSDSPSSTLADGTDEYDNDTDSVELKRRIDAILNRSSGNSHQSSQASKVRSDRADQADCSVSGKRYDTPGAFAKDRKLADLLARGKSLVKAREDSALLVCPSTSDVTDLVSLHGDEAVHPMLDHVFDGADRFLHSIGITGEYHGGSNSSRRTPCTANEAPQQVVVTTKPKPSFALRGPVTLVREHSSQQLLDKRSASNNVPRLATHTLAESGGSKSNRSIKSKFSSWKIARSAASAIRNRERRRRVVLNKTEHIASAAVPPTVSSCAVPADPQQPSASVSTNETLQLPSNLFFVPLYPPREARSSEKAGGAECDRVEPQSLPQLSTDDSMVEFPDLLPGSSRLT